MTRLPQDFLGKKGGREMHSQVEIDNPTKMGFGIYNCHLVKTKPSAITSLVHSPKRLLIWTDGILHDVKRDAATSKLRLMSMSVSIGVGVGILIAERRSRQTKPVLALG